MMRPSFRAEVVVPCCRCALVSTLGILLWAALASGAWGAWQDDIGYTQLQDFLGSNLPDGSGVPIALVEADTGGRYYPNTNDIEFGSSSDPLQADVTFIDGSGGQAAGISGHATSQAESFFGNATSVAPAANGVTVYEAEDYLNEILNLAATNSTVPAPQEFRVQNFSWIKTGWSENEDREALRRFDYAIDTNNITALVALSNASSPLPALLSHSYNSLAIGCADGAHSSGLTNVSRYGVGRSKPDLVAPRGSTSSATSSTSSAATFLHSADFVQGTDAAQSETMKSILMAGATKAEFPTWSQLDADGQWHPLDDTYGAGELNLYNSYLIAMGGQAVGNTTTPTPAASHGWDYQTVQPGALNKLLYDFVVPTGSVAAELSIVLAWNAETSAPFHTGDPVVADLDLELVDSLGMPVDLDPEDSLVEGLSQSDVDNVEHLYVSNLPAGTYTLGVSSDDLARDFGLSWRTSTLFLAPSADFDADGDLDAVDFLTWQQGYGTLLGATLAMGDGDGDGDVDADDLAIFNAGFGSSPPPLAGFSIAAPEPASAVLAAAGLFAFFLSRRPPRDVANAYHC
ncbi:MAG: S8 family peptidase [Pirellulales bacterium]|nr:S8 family peptidase [Pirellulales bacterium]